MTTKEIIPFEATHPGTLILDEIKARDIKQKELAAEIGVLPTFLNEIIKGKRPITADFAILLEKALDIPADFWMKFQSQYEIDKARLKEKNIRRIEMMKRKTSTELETKYFGEPGTPEREQYEFEMNMELIGAKLKQLRKRQKLTQQQLGSLVGVQKEQISKLEKGNNSATIATINKVFRALKTKVELKLITG